MLDALDGARVLITGGTGYVGRCLLDAIAGTRAEVTVLSRNPPSNLQDVKFIRGDVVDFEADGAFTHIVHAASDTRDAVRDPRGAWSVVVDGTRHVLEIAARSKARLLLVSSGAVYGASHDPIDETLATAPPTNDPGSIYGEAKRAAEMLCTLYASDVESMIARCFTFIGPHLSLERPFAVCAFFRAALKGEAIRIAQPETRRSYLFSTDLAEWLWTILLRGTPLRPYNVGSPVSVTMRELAELIRNEVEPSVEIIEGAGGAPTTYVPSTARVEQELGLGVRVPLAEAVRRSAAWYRLQSPLGA